MTALRDSWVDPHLMMEIETQKDKPGHTKLFKTLFEQKLIPLSQGQTRGSTRSPGNLCRRDTKAKKGNYLIGYGLVGGLWLLVPEFQFCDLEALTGSDIGVLM